MVLFTQNFPASLDYFVPICSPGGGALRGDLVHDPAHDRLRRRSGGADRAGQPPEGCFPHGPGEAQAAAGHRHDERGQLMFVLC